MDLQLAIISVYPEVLRLRCSKSGSLFIDIARDNIFAWGYGHLGSMFNQLLFKEIDKLT